MLSDKVHVTLGGGNGLGGITGDDGTCKPTHAGKPSLPYCLEESGEGRASKGKVGGGYEDGVFNISDGGKERGGEGREVRRFGETRKGMMKKLAPPRLDYGRPACRIPHLPEKEEWN